MIQIFIVTLARFFSASLRHPDINIVLHIVFFTAKLVSVGRHLTAVLLADIQEFYEVTLLDDSKSVQQKTAETLQIASKWEITSGPMAPHITCPKDVSLPFIALLWR